MAPGQLSRRALAELVSAVLLAVVGVLGSARPGLAEAVDASLASAVAGALAPLDGSGHHFGFGQASVLAQATATATAGVATQVAAPTPPLSGTPGTQGACTTQVGSSCAIQGNVNGMWTKTSSGTLTVAVSTPAGAVLNGGAPMLFVPTTIGVEQFHNACYVPTAVGGLVTCTATTVGDPLTGGTVVVRFVGLVGPIDQTGTIQAGPPLPPTGSPLPTGSLRKYVTAIDSAALPAGQTRVDATPGATLVFRVEVPSSPCFPGVSCYPYGGVGVLVADFVSSRFAFNINDVAGSDCVIAPTPARRPAGVAADATTVLCSFIPSFASTATINMVARLRPDAAAGADPQANVACLVSDWSSPNGPTYAACSSVEVRVAAPTATPTPPPTPGPGLTLQQALSAVSPSGQSGVPCASLAGTACTVEGATSGQGVVVASMRWTLTATVPAGVVPGTVPFAVFTTTVGGEGFACTPVVAGAPTVSCTGSTAGNALRDSTVTVIFGPGVTATGNVTSTTSAPPPLLAAPPLAPPPPPAPPAVVPPAPLPPPLAIPPSSMPGPSALRAEVPVVPEADSLPLLFGGLAVCAGFAWLRQRAPR